MVRLEVLLNAISNRLDEYGIVGGGTVVEFRHGDVAIHFVPGGSDYCTGVIQNLYVKDIDITNRLCRDADKRSEVASAMKRLADLLEQKSDELIQGVIDEACKVDCADAI